MNVGAVSCTDLTHSNARLITHPTGVFIPFRHLPGSLFSDITRIRSNIRKAVQNCVKCAVVVLTVKEKAIGEETAAVLTLTVIVLHSHEFGANP